MRQYGHVRVTPLNTVEYQQVPQHVYLTGYTLWSTSKFLNMYIPRGMDVPLDKLMHERTALAIQSREVGLKKSR